MNDPHVVALLYSVNHGKSHDYSKAVPLVRDEPDFRLEIKNNQARFEMKEHFATKNDARKAVEDYIRNWEFDACLKGGEDCFKLEFIKAIREDRRPTPGVISVDADPVRFSFHVSTPKVTVGHPKYPATPSGVNFNDPDVKTIYQRYMGYRQSNEPLASMAYFCLSFLEYSMSEKRNEGPKTSRLRKMAAKKYKIEEAILVKIGELSSEKGGQDARKAVGANKDFTNRDRTFLDQAIMRIIQRVAEKAHNPDDDLPEITFSDLPPI